MEHFDESGDDGTSEAELELDSDPEELWRSLIADEEYPRYWSESVWTHDAEDVFAGGALLVAGPAVLAGCTRSPAAPERPDPLEAPARRAETDSVLAQAVAQMAAQEGAQTHPALATAATALAIGAGGALSSIQTTVLLSVEETLDALKKTSSIKYRPPGN